MRTLRILRDNIVSSLNILFYIFIIKTFINMEELDKNTGTEQEKKTKRTPRLPQSEEDLKNLAVRVLEKWKEDGMTLRWKTVEAFETELNAYQEILALRTDKGDARRPITQKLKNLDKEIDKHAAYIKNYIQGQIGLEEAKAYYAQFGLEKVGKGYQIPVDRDARLKSLKKTVQAMAQHNMLNQKYGKVYWEGLVTEYETLMQEASQTDAAISEKVRDKNKYRDEIKLVLKSLLKLLEGHYPKGFEATARAWGFQKGKY